VENAFNPFAISVVRDSAGYNWPRAQKNLGCLFFVHCLPFPIHVTKLVKGKFVEGAINKKNCGYSASRWQVTTKSTKI